MAPGRCSSSARRRQILNSQSLYSAQDKRQQLPNTLRQRFQKLQALITKLRTKLEEAYASPLLIQDLIITVTPEFIQRQIKSQREVFDHWKTSTDKKKLYQEVYEAVKAEIREEESLALQANNPDIRPSNLPELVAATDLLLEKHHLTRQQWEFGGALWSLYEREKTPNQSIFDRLKQEKLLRDKIAAERRKVTARQPRIQRWIHTSEAQLQRITANINSLLEAQNMTREQWAPGSELMTSLQNEGILVAMDGIT